MFDQARKSTTFSLRHHALAHLCPASRTTRPFFALVLFLSVLPVSVVATVASDSPAADNLYVLQPGEKFPGGAATSRKSVKTKNAFSHSSGNLSFAKELDFKIGNGIFRKLWVSAPASTTASDGLGPLFNARSCQRCHLKDGRGHPPSANWPDDDAISMFLRISIPAQTRKQLERLRTRTLNAIPDPTYGTQLQDLSIQGHKAEGKMHVDYEEIAVALNGGQMVSLRKPTYTVTNLGYGPLHKDAMLSPRIAPPMIGLGLLEAIDDEDILQFADEEDANADGISGRPNRVWSQIRETVSLGRFGWKAGNATIADQSAHAFVGDMGLSTPLFTNGHGECTKNQKFCLDAPTGATKRYGDVEVSQKMFDLVVFYAQNLAVPERRNPNAKDVLQGKKLFHELGCSTCHRPNYTTGKRAQAPHLSDQKIWPYTDLLLHDMGEGLADNRPEGLATGREWKTPPLWGIGLTQIVSGHTFYLHDGRARNVLEAILWHGGEAQAARDKVIELSPSDRSKLIKFVNSL